MLDKTRFLPPEAPWRGFVVPPALRTRYPNVKWQSLTEEETWEVCLFALALAEAREQVVASFYHNMDLLQSRIAAFSKGI